MPTPTIDATPGGSAANSYCTLAEANTYHDSRLANSAWTSASSANQTVALVMAARVLDAMYDWVSWRTTTTQALEWPRTGVLAKNELVNIGDMVIPQELKNAQAELAFQLLSGDRTLDSDIETQGITGLSAGPVSLSFKNEVYAKVIPDAVYNLIPYWWGTVRGRSAETRDLMRV